MATDFLMNDLSDGIEYLYTSPQKRGSRKPPNDDAFTCAMCNESLDHLTVDEKQRHYNAHLDGDDGATPSVVLEMSGGGAFSKYFANSTFGSSRKRSKPPKPSENVFWHPLSNSPPPLNYTPCLVPLLKRHLISLHSKSIPTSTSRAVLCSTGVTHISSERFDKLWGCGYRNFLMACTALITQSQQPLYFPILDGDPSKPIGLRNVQRWIEDAWNEGYDALGAQDLNGKLYQTHKWIGTGELFVAFTYRGLPCRLVDFPKAKSSTDTAEALTQWIVEYFSPSASSSASPHVSAFSKTNPSALDALKSTSVIMTSRMPVILQHKGHSRTIIGYEIMKNGAINLLALDPARCIEENVREAALAQYRLIKQNGTTTSASPSTSKSPLLSSTTANTHNPFKKTTNLAKNFVHSPSNKSPIKRVQDKLKGKKREYIDVDLDEADVGATQKRMKGEIKPQVSAGVADAKVIDVDSDVEEVLVVPKPSSKIKAKGKEVNSVASSSKTPSKHTAPTTPASEHDSLDSLKLVKMFRVDVKKLSKQEQYQLLWFPLTAPLTEIEKKQRKTVTSERIET